VKILKDPQREVLFTEAVSRIQKAIESSSNDRVTISLCGGSSIVGLIQHWLKSSSFPLAYWKRLDFFMVDERRVPLDSPESNFKLLNDSFFSVLLADGRIGKNQIHAYDASLENAEEVYSDELRKFNSAFEISILGSGEDGHVAGIFPNREFPEMKDTFFLRFDDSPKPPKERMTAHPSLVSASQLCILMFLGDGKREAFNRFTDDAISLSDCPAKLVTSAKDSLVISDIL